MKNTKYNKSYNDGSSEKPVFYEPKIERIQKIISQSNIASRRAAEKMIEQGLVLINGKKAILGDKASLKDRITVNNKPLRTFGAIMTRPRVRIYHKPEGIICSKRDEEGRKTVYDALPRLERGRWIMIGRLDLNTSGLLLFTTDGDLAHRLMHPSYEIEREYAVRIFGNVTDDMIKNIKNGVNLETGMSKFNVVEFKGGEGINKWYHVILRGGKNREVRRLWESQGVKASRLTRIRYGDLVLPRWLSRNKSDELFPDEVNVLRESVKLEKYHYPKNLLNNLNRKQNHKK